MGIKQELRNRNVKCGGKSVIRDATNTPILDFDGARQYKPCENWAANGTSWCQKHGGGLESTIKAAQRRMLYGADDIVEILERIAKDENLPAKERIAAINSYLDRAGLRGGLDVSIETPGWQKVLDKLYGVDDEAETAAEEPPTPPEVEAPPSTTPKPRKRATKAATPVKRTPEFQGW
jgi:hypothetical protein